MLTGRYRSCVIGTGVLEEGGYNEYAAVVLGIFVGSEVGTVGGVG